MPRGRPRQVRMAVRPKASVRRPRQQYRLRAPERLPHLCSWRRYNLSSMDSRSTEFENWKPLSTTDRGDNNTFWFVLGNDIAIKAAQAGNISPWPDGVGIGKMYPQPAERKAVQSEGIHFRCPGTALFRSRGRDTLGNQRENCATAIRWRRRRAEMGKRGDLRKRRYQNLRIPQSARRSISRRSLYPSGEKLLAEENVQLVDGRVT